MKKTTVKNNKVKLSLNGSTTSKLVLSASKLFSAEKHKAFWIMLIIYCVSLCSNKSNGVEQIMQSHVFEVNKNLFSEYFKRNIIS